MERWDKLLDGNAPLDEVRCHLEDSFQNGDFEVMNERPLQWEEVFVGMPVYWRHGLDVKATVFAFTEKRVGIEVRRKDGTPRRVYVQLSSLHHREEQVQGKETEMTIDEQIRRNIESEPIFIPYIGSDAPVHTDETPFCSDPECPCHLDIRLLKEQVFAPFFDGLLTNAEAKRLMDGRQL